MTSSAADLQRAVFQALSANNDLITALGGLKIYDHATESVDFPYIILGRISSVDWSTVTEDGAEHRLTVHLWSQRSGRVQLFQLQQMVEDTLHDADLPGQDHHIVNLRLEAFEARRDASSNNLHGIMRFRAVTEPAN